MESQFDQMTKLLAEGIPRRQALWRLGGLFGGAILASLGWGNNAKADENCDHTCKNFRIPEQRNACKEACEGCPSTSVVCFAALAGPLDFTCCATPCCGGEFGECCPSGWECCDGRRCCPPGFPCCSGVCCNRGQVCCKGMCTTVSSDVNNCGGCGVHCPANKVCSKGMCVDTCAPGETNCHRDCVDLANDPNHCGDCDDVCTGGKVCTGGRCGCPRGLTFCDNEEGNHDGDHEHNGTCVDTMTDRNNCGGCGNVCRADEVCRSGMCTRPTTVCASDNDCAPACPAGHRCRCCNGTCDDTTTDTMNCGGCGTICPSGTVCLGGMCRAPTGCASDTDCIAPLGCCSAACVNRLNDPANCGSCGNACQPGNVCCNGSCKNPAVDRMNCGVCGVICTGHKVCGGGACNFIMCTSDSQCTQFSSRCDLSGGAPGVCGYPCTFNVDCPGNGICRGGFCF